MLDHLIQLSPLLGLIASLVAAGATVVLAVITRSYVALTTEILEVNQAVLQMSTSPHVVVTVIARDGRLITVLENVGNYSATCVKVQISPEIDPRLFHPKILPDTIPAVLNQTHLGPRSKIEAVIGYTKDILNRPDFSEITTKYDVTISYSSTSRDHVAEHIYSVDLAGVLVPRKSRMESIGFKLDKIEKSLNSIRDTIQAIVK